MAQIASIALLSLAAGLGAGPAAAISAPGEEAWRGLYCTRPGCVVAPAAPADTAGFGAALLGAVWVARRRRRR